jgi:hypothetical protein
MQSSNEQHAKQIYFEAMGIAMAVRGHAGAAGLFQELDAALTGPDWSALRVILDAFDRLPAPGQRLILSEMGDPEAVGYALAQFERTLRELQTASTRRSA